MAECGRLEPRQAAADTRRLSGGDRSTWACRQSWTLYSSLNRDSSHLSAMACFFSACLDGVEGVLPCNIRCSGSLWSSTFRYRVNTCCSRWVTSFSSAVISVTSFCVWDTYSSPFVSYRNRSRLNKQAWRKMIWWERSCLLEELNYKGHLEMRKHHQYHLTLVQGLVLQLSHLPALSAAVLPSMSKPDC